MTERTSDDSAASSRAAAVTPAVALARHVEWLEFALAAARSEEAWRVGRLDKATKKSREKRTARLTDVRDEIAELSALLDGIRGLQAKPTRRAAAGTGRGRGRPRGSRTVKAANVAATPTADGNTTIADVKLAKAPTRRRSAGSKAPVRTSVRTRTAPAKSGIATAPSRAKKASASAAATTPTSPTPARRRKAATPPVDAPA